MTEMDNQMIGLVQGMFNHNPKLASVRLRSFIWAAKGRTCPVCPAQVGQPCFNMADINRAISDDHHKVRANKWPHDNRVDWQRLYDALIERGYGE